MKYDFELVLENENALSKIINQIDRNSLVLEFGSAAGRMTRYLKEHLNCKVYIVEIDPESAKSAMQFAEDAVVGDIEDLEWMERWEEKRFDFIVFADVLEHLHNPQKVMSKTKLLLKDDGKTIISVPNVAHNSILINLFQNIFNYTPVGLLDHTHVHLFAYNTLKFVCAETGYIPVLEDAVYADVDENEVAASYDQLDIAVQTELKKRIYNNVYQFVFVLQKKEYVRQQGITVEKKIIAYTKDYKLQFFFDRGEGWLEENSITIPIRFDGQKKIVIPLSNVNEIKNVRFDPIDCRGGVCIESIRLLDKDNNEKMDLTGQLDMSNAEYQINNNFLFLTDDPNIYLTRILWEDIDKIEVSFSLMSIGEMAIRMLKWNKENYEKTALEWKRKEEDLEQENVELEKKLGQIRADGDRRIAELEQQIDAVNTFCEENAVLKNELKLCREELEKNALELEQKKIHIQELDQKNRLLEQELESQTIWDVLGKKIKESHKEV